MNQIFVSEFLRSIKFHCPSLLLSIFIDIITLLHLLITVVYIPSYYLLLINLLELLLNLKTYGFYLKSVLGILYNASNRLSYIWVFIREITLTSNLYYE